MENQSFLCTSEIYQDDSQTLNNLQISHKKSYNELQVSEKSIPKSACHLTTSTSSLKEDITCKVCGDKASGKHYGVLSCDGCRGFFKRSIRRNLAYICKENGTCVVDVTRRNQCQACRFRKCLEVNMKRDAVQHERAPRGCLAKCFTYSSIVTEADGDPWTKPYCGVMSTFYPIKNMTQNMQSSFSSTPLPYVHQVSQERKLESMESSNANQTNENKKEIRRHYQNEEMNTENVFSTNHFREKTREEGANEIFATPFFRFHHQFNGLQQPILGSFPTNDIFPFSTAPESFHETAARLLFLAVKWARNIPAFLQLPFRDQAILLEEAWAELFVINAAQWSLPIDDGALVSSSGMPLERQSALLVETRMFREVISRFSHLQVDQTEYACLKALVLFKPEAQGLREPFHVESLQDQTHVMLQEYSLSKQPISKVRYGKLLLLLPAVHSIHAAAIEDMFFRKTIGGIPIERLLCDMFKSS